MWFRRKSSKELEEAQEALKEAEETLKDIQDRGEEVTKVSKSLREFRERNHFAEKLEEIIFRRGGPLHDS